MCVCCQAFGTAAKAVRDWVADTRRYTGLQSTCREVVVDKSKDPYSLETMDEVEAEFDDLDQNELVALADQYYEKEHAFLFRK